MLYFLGAALKRFVSYQGWRLSRPFLCGEREKAMLNEDLLAILACPACKTRVELVADKWLVCQNSECRRKYPIRDDIPIMLIEEGTKYIDVPIEKLAEMEP
jgi:uncharacterized protein YbaR (Trm112 family)